MSNLQHVCNKILDLLHDIEPNDNFLSQVRKPKLSDKELLALSLSAESLGIDSEHFLFKQLPPEVYGRIERSVYNRRARRLSFKLEDIRQHIAEKMMSKDDLYIVDSMPLEVCKMSRARRSKIFQEHEHSAPSYGFCAAQNTHYFGYKLHVVCTPDGILKMFDISKASQHDIHFLNDIQDTLKNCVLVGDKGYLSRQWQTDLFQHSAINLETPMRRNQTNFKVLPKPYRRARKRIEILFSQLCDQFMIRRNYAKSFTGIARRIVAKVAALTIIQ